MIVKLNRLPSTANAFDEDSEDDGDVANPATGAVVASAAVGGGGMVMTLGRLPRTARHKTNDSDSDTDSNGDVGSDSDDSGEESGAAEFEFEEDAEVVEDELCNDDILGDFFPESFTNAVASAGVKVTESASSAGAFVGQSANDFVSAVCAGATAIGDGLMGAVGCAHMNRDAALEATP